MFEFMIIIVIILVFIKAFSGNINTLTCDKFNIPHTWILKETNNNRYLVCSKCKMLPGGNFEEGER